MDERPGLYVRLEVGVSWPRHFNKRRSISYTSGAIPDRQQRLLPSTNPASHNETWAPSNDHHQFESDQAYLRHVYNYASQSNYPPEQPYWHRHQAAAPIAETVARPLPPSSDQPSVANDQYVAYHPSYRHQALQYPHSDYLPRRSRSLSSHNSRNTSTPFSAQERPWDAEPEPMGSTALPARNTSSGPRSQAWKPLPATPNQFRLGEDSMPWSGSPDPADYSAVETSRRGRAEVSNGSVGSTSKYSPQRSLDDRDRGRTVEMQSLATALMTVDNGFEDQWWFQGPRMVTMAGD